MFTWGGNENMGFNWEQGGGLFRNMGNFGSNLFFGKDLFGAGGIFDGSQDQMVPFGDASDVQNVNPYTDAYMQQMMGFGGNMNNQFMQSLGTGQPRDPNAAFNAWTSQNPAYMQAAQSFFDPYASQEQANYLSNQAIENISGQLSNQGQGSLRSGAGMSAIMEGALNPLTQMNTQMAQMVGGAATGLAGQGMADTYGRYNMLDQLGLQRSSMLGNMALGGYGMAGQLAGQEWWQPGYANNQNFMSAPGMVNAGLGFLGGIFGGR
jgi:hypothetical protein